MRVKPHAEILETLKTDSANRGLDWDAEMVPLLRRNRLLKRVTQVIDEKAGKMVKMNGAGAARQVLAPWAIAARDRGREPIAERPPHRSQRAQLTHWAPTSGI